MLDISQYLTNMTKVKLSVTLGDDNIH